MLRPNPLTGVLEDDGLPDPAAPLPLVAPILQATPESTGGGAPAPAAPAAPIQILAPPEESHRVEQTGPQTTQAVASPGAAKALGELDDARARESAAGDEIIDQKVVQADQAATLAEEQAKLAQQRAAAEAAARKAHEQQVASLVAEKERLRVAEERAAHPKTYWEDKSVPSRILAGLLMIVGGGTSGLARTENLAAKAYRDAEQDDRQRKLDAFKNATEFRKLAEQDIVAAQAQLGDFLAKLTQDEITKSNLLVKNAEALAKRTGLPHVLANAQQLKAARDAENAEKAVRLHQHYDQSVQSGRVTTSDTVNVNRGGQQSLGVFGPGGASLGTTGDPKKDKELSGLVAPYRDLRQLLTDLRATYKDGAQISPLSDAAKHRAELASEAKVAFNRDRAKLGALAGQDLSIIEGAIGSGNAVFTGDHSPRLEKALSVLDRGMGITIDSYGLPGQKLVSQLTAPAAAQSSPTAPAAAPAPAAKPKARETKQLKDGTRWYRLNGGPWRAID